MFSRHAGSSSLSSSPSVEPYARSTRTFEVDVRHSSDVTVSIKDSRSARSSALRRAVVGLSAALGCLALLVLAQQQSLVAPFPTHWLPSMRALSSPAAAGASSFFLRPHLPPPPTLADVQRDPAQAFLPHPALKPTPEYLATLPSRCGHWMPGYIAFHASVASGRYFLDGLNRTGEVPVAPLAVYRVNPEERLGGISDRWPPLSTALLVSVLVQRALFIDWPGYEAAYTHVHLPYLTNTTWRDVYAMWQWYGLNKDAVLSALRAGRPPPRPPRLSSVNVTVAAADLLDTGTHDLGLTREHGEATITIEEVQSSQALREAYHPERAVVYMTQAFWSKGLLTKFFASPLREELWAMGLRLATCHGCMINLLMAVNRRVMDLFAPYALRLRQLDQLTVGLQIRMGDAAMTGKAGLTEQHQADLRWQDDDATLLRYLHMWTQCAQQLLDLHADAVNQTHLLFLVSDSAKARGLLMQEIGAPLLTVVPEGELALGHTDTGDPLLFNGTKTALDKNRAGDYLRMAAGEQWLLAYCDFLVIEHLGSGFGRSASFRSIKVGHTWNARQRGQRCDDDHGQLTVSDFDSFGHRY